MLLLLIGIGILAYPVVSNYVNQKNSSYALEQLTSRLGNSDREEIEQQRESAKRYNEALMRGEETGYDDILNFGNGLMGAVEIPGIQVNLPIYHGISEDILAKGVGHMASSALPVGGEGNHTVLTGHTGLPSAKLFTDLDKMEVGDLFYLNVLGESLAYKVDQVKVVLPTDGTDLERQPGKDYCTLLTCTPYGVNSHRLLVRGERVELPTVEAMAQTGERKRGINWNVVAIVSGSVFVISIGLLVFLLRRHRKL